MMMFPADETKQQLENIAAAWRGCRVNRTRRRKDEIDPTTINEMEWNEFSNYYPAPAHNYMV